MFDLLTVCGQWVYLLHIHNNGNPIRLNEFYKIMIRS